MRGSPRETLLPSCVKPIPSHAYEAEGLGSELNFGLSPDVCHWLAPHFSSDANLPKFAETGCNMGDVCARAVEQSG